MTPCPSVCIGRTSFLGFCYGCSIGNPLHKRTWFASRFIPIGFSCGNKAHLDSRALTDNFQLRFFDFNLDPCCFSPREMFEYAKCRIWEQIRIKNRVYGGSYLH